MPDASPVNSDSLIIPSSGNDVCDALLGMVQSLAVLRADLGYRVDKDSTNPGNAPTVDFAAHLGAMILPPGVVLPFSLGVASATDATLQAAVRAIWGAPAGEDDEAWWILCNGEDGSPDLRGRFIRGAGTNADDEAFTAGTPGGSDKTTLGIGHLPNHRHKLAGYGEADATGAGNNDMGFYSIPAEDTAEFTGKLLHTTSTGERPVTISKINTVTGKVHDYIAPEGETVLDPVNTVPKHVVLVYAMRTTRMV